jgi:mRNA interferase HicA
MKYREIAGRLHDLSCLELAAGKGSHRKWHNPAKDKVTVIPDWGSKDLAAGTVRAVIRELGISRDSFGPIKEKSGSKHLSMSTIINGKISAKIDAFA